MHADYRTRHHRRTLSPPAWAAIGAVTGVTVAMLTGMLHPQVPCVQRMRCAFYAEEPAEIQPGWQMIPASSMRPAEHRPVLVCAGGAK